MKQDEDLKNINEEEVAEVSKFKKIVSIGIVGLIVLAMSAFGIMDFVSVGSDYAIKVDEKKITPAAFARALDSQRKQYMYRFGSGIIESFLNKKEFVFMVANSMADQLLIAKMLEENGIIVNKETVNKFILQSPQFAGTDGKFDKIFFKTYLAQMGISEENYIAEQISVIQMKFFSELISLNNLVFKEDLAKKLISEERQKREIKIFKMPIAIQNPEVSEQEILSYYISNKEEFAEPEKRVVRLAKIDVQALPSNAISTSDLVKTYNKEYLYKNQKISFYKLSFPSMDEAKFAENLIKKEGLAFTEVAKESLGLKASEIYFKDTDFKDLNSEMVEEIAGLKKFEVSKIFYSNGTYNIIKLDEISNAKVPSFESVKDKISQTLRKENSCSLVQKMAETIGGELESGAALEEGIKAPNMIKTIIIEENGNDFLPENIKLSILKDTDTYYSKLIQAKSCEFYAYQITEIKEKTFAEIENVKPIIIAKLKEEKMRNLAFTKANDLYAQFSSNGDISGEKLTVSKNDPSLTEEMKTSIFAAQGGDFIIPAISKNGKEFWIIKLESIKYFDPKQISQSDLKVKIKELETEQRDKLLLGFLEDLRAKHKITINYSYVRLEE